MLLGGQNGSAEDGFNLDLLRPQLSIHNGDEYGSRREYANDNDVDGLLGDDSDDIPLTQLGHRRHARQEMSWPSWPSSFASNPIGSLIPGTSRENLNLQNGQRSPRS